MTIQIPRTAPRKSSERTYARLICPLSRAGYLSDGPMFKPGASIEESELWPTDHYPRLPLLHEYAGSTGLDAAGRPARGHNRTREINLLWRYDPDTREWREIVRLQTEGNEWATDLIPIIEREMVRPVVDHLVEARDFADRLNGLIDGGLRGLCDEAGNQAVSFLYQRMAARFVNSMSQQAQSLRGSLFGLTEDSPVIDWDELRLHLRKPAGRALSSTGESMARRAGAARI